MSAISIRIALLKTLLIKSMKQNPTKEEKKSARYLYQYSSFHKFEIEVEYFVNEK